MTLTVKRPKAWRPPGPPARDTGQWDASAFEAWLAQSVSHRVAFCRLNAAWDEAGRLSALRSATGIEESFSQPTPGNIFVPADARAPENIDFHPVRIWALRRQVFAAAAGLAIVLMGTIAVWNLERSELDHFTTVIGGLEAAPLADGSRVTSNTDSELPVSLQAQERVVSASALRSNRSVRHLQHAPMLPRCNMRARILRDSKNPATITMRPLSPRPET
jgi:ferric-dicitrate binding protein FerR (iron transport regulator)